MRLNRTIPCPSRPTKPLRAPPIWASKSTVVLDPRDIGICLYPAEMNGVAVTSGLESRSRSSEGPGGEPRLLGAAESRAAQGPSLRRAVLPKLPKCTKTRSLAMMGWTGPRPTCVLLGKGRGRIARTTLPRVVGWFRGRGLLVERARLVGWQEFAVRISKQSVTFWVLFVFSHRRKG